MEKTRFFKLVRLQKCIMKCITFKNKSQFTTQALFGILMLALFVGILVYGYTALSDASSEISARDLDELRQTIEQRTSVCAQPSQRGRVETINVPQNQITHICYISNIDAINQFNPEFGTIASQVGIVQSHTIVLLNGPTDRDFYNILIGGNFQQEFERFMIYDIIELREGASLSDPINECQIRDQGNLRFRFTC